MLNKDSLSQLKGLKAQMAAEKEYAEATVKGTQSRYGFAVLADGREIFIPPEEMLKAFPGEALPPPVMRRGTSSAGSSMRREVRRGLVSPGGWTESSSYQIS